MRPTVLPLLLSLLLLAGCAAASRAPAPAPAQFDLPAQRLAKADGRLAAEWPDAGVEYVQWKSDRGSFRFSIVDSRTDRGYEVDFDRGAKSAEAVIRRSVRAGAADYVSAPRKALENVGYRMADGAPALGAVWEDLGFMAVRSAPAKGENPQFLLMDGRLGSIYGIELDPAAGTASVHVERR